MRQLPCRSAPADPRAYLRCLGAISKQRETCSSSPRRTLDVFNQPTEAISFGISNSHRRIKNLFGDFGHAMQQRAAPGQHDAARKLSLPTRVFDLIGDVHQHFFSTRLKDVTQDLPRELSWRTPTYGRHIDELTSFHLTQRAAASTANCPFHFFSFRNRGAQTESDVIREMRTAQRENCGVLNSATLVNNESRRFGANVHECSSKFFVIIS